MVALHIVCSEDLGCFFPISINTLLCLLLFAIFAGILIFMQCAAEDSKMGLKDGACKQTVALCRRIAQRLYATSLSSLSQMLMVFFVVVVDSNEARTVFTVACDEVRLILSIKYTSILSHVRPYVQTDITSEDRIKNFVLSVNIVNQNVQ